MNLTPPAMRVELMSEVEKNKALLLPGDKLTGYDNVYTIDEITEDGFTTACGDAFCFDSLQIGWTISRAQNEYKMLRLNSDNPNYSRWLTWTEYRELFQIHDRH